MNKKTKTHYETRANIIKALANATRIFIIEELSQQEKCVSEITKMVGTDVSTISKHLLVLKNAGIVVDDKRGNQVFYKLRVPCVLNFFTCIETVLKEINHKYRK